MSSEAKDYSIHLVGLGGAGANILEAFLRSPGIHDFLKTTGVRLSLLALDVADHDIQSLQRRYDQFAGELREKGIPSDKVSLIAKSVKFTTPEALFDFIERFPEFLKQEGTKVPENYVPWLSSAIDIPPLSGGVGRRRALSKGIYSLNYYYFNLIGGLVESFTEKVSSSVLQPIVYVIFGLGGGSGSGMGVDFVRHLRKRLGRSFPIIGLAVLPCQGDDPPARGASAYASLCEFELLAEKEKNRLITQAFGEVYSNPFTGFLLIPLGPPYSRTGNMAQTKVFTDDAIADMLFNSIRFDLSDLFNNIGCNLELGERWIHTASTLRITYSINEHIAIAKLYLSLLDELRNLRRDKIELCIGSVQSSVGGMMRILQYCMDELRDIYRQLLIERDNYDPKTFDEKVRLKIAEDKALELNLNMQIKGAEESILTSMRDVGTPLTTIGLNEPEGTPEARVRKLVDETMAETKNIMRKYPEYHEFSERIVDDLSTSTNAIQKLTFKHKLLLGDLADCVRLIDAYLIVLRTYMETKSLAESLHKDLSSAEKTALHKSALEVVQKMLNPELNAIFNVISGLMALPTSHIKAVDTTLTVIRVARKALSERLDRFKSERQIAEIKIRNIESEQEKMKTALSGIKVPWSGRKKFLEKKINDMDQDLIQARAELDDALASVKKVEEKIKEYSELEKKFDVNSDYRKTLGMSVILANQHYEKLNEVSKDRGYYDRVAEIGEDERLKIVQKIISDEEASLTRENILKEIVDKRRLNEYLTSVLRIFRIPSTLGLTPAYRTNYIWVTVVAPRGVWDQDMTLELKATLSGYILGDASQVITVREIDSKDPWTIRILVIASKACAEEIEGWDQIKKLYEQTPREDRVLAHSFLLEQGIIATRDIADKIPKQKVEKSAP